MSWSTVDAQIGQMLKTGELNGPLFSATIPGPQEKSDNTILTVSSHSRLPLHQRDSSICRGVAQDSFSRLPQGLRKSQVETWSLWWHSWLRQVSDSFDPGSRPLGYFYEYEDVRT